MNAVDHPRPTAGEPPATRTGTVIGGILPFIGLILFLGATAVQFASGAGADWGPTLVGNAITYLIGWAGIGAGISHMFFGDKISRTIGFHKTAYEFEVGAAGFAMGVVGLLATSFDTDYWFAIILVSSIYRVLCGVGHVRSIVQEKNYAINNTAILFIDFVVPAFLLVAYAMWAH